MNNEELRKKICNIIAPYVSAYGDDERIADVLIAAGIGDVAELQKECNSKEMEHQSGGEIIMLPFGIDLDLYNVVRDWCIQCNAIVSIKVKDKTIEIYTDKPGQMIGLKGSLISKYEYALRQYRRWKDYNFAIYEITMTITPDSPKISQEEYDKEWEEHIKFRFSGYDE